MLVTFDRWYKYEELMKEIPFIAFRRSDVDDNLFDNDAKLLSNNVMRLTVKNEVIPCVSSTEIRNNF